MPPLAFRLAGRVLFRVTGLDRIRYLNGQTTNDLRRLQPDVAMHSLILTAKGRLCAPILIWSGTEELFIEAPASLAETLPARLERYAIADDVVFDLVGDHDTAWHVAGISELPGRQANRIGIPGVDVAHLPEGCRESSRNEIAFCRIAHGVPEWGAELDDHSLPHETGLDRTAVDFHKGCYVGQEVVSRVESAGRLNRRLVGLQLSHSEPLPDGALHTATEGKKVGELTSRVELFGKSIALGFIPFLSHEKKFTLLNETGACLGEAERCEFPLNSQ